MILENDDQKMKIPIVIEEPGVGTVGGEEAGEVRNTWRGYGGRTCSQALAVKLNTFELLSCEKLISCYRQKKGNPCIATYGLQTFQLKYK